MYDLIVESRKLVDMYDGCDETQRRKILRTEFSKWNHPIRMKFLVGAGVERHAHEFLDALLDVAREKNALLTGPLVFEQVQYMAHHFQFKSQSFDLAQKSLTLRPPKQLHYRCHALADKGLWRWAGLLFPYIKDNAVVEHVYHSLLKRMGEIYQSGQGTHRFETFSDDLYYMITHDPKGMERWAALSGVATYFPIAQSIEAKLSKHSLQDALVDVERPVSVRKM